MTKKGLHSEKGVRYAARIALTRCQAAQDAARRRAAIAALKNFAKSLLKSLFRRGYTSRGCEDSDKQSFSEEANTASSPRPLPSFLPFTLYPSSSVFICG